MKRKAFYILLVLTILSMGGMAQSHPRKSSSHKKYTHKSYHRSSSRSKTKKTVVAKTDTTQKEQEKKAKTTISICTDKTVDLGLPSGTKWAGWNIGAKSAEQPGSFYAWGEIAPKKDYTWETYFDSTNGTAKEFNIFSSSKAKNLSGSSYDVARKLWGADWCMPTLKQLKELKEKCKWTWTTYKKMKGYAVTGPNGKSIFFPASGQQSGENANYVSTNGGCWASTLNSKTESQANGLYFNATSVYVSAGNRCLGRCVRAVRK